MVYLAYCIDHSIVAYKSYCYSKRNRCWMEFTLRGARLVDATMDRTDSAVTIDGVSIQGIETDDRKGQVVIDASDAIITPCFVEVHTHGGGGFNLHTDEADEIASYARWIPTTGVTSFLIAVVGTPYGLPVHNYAQQSLQLSTRIEGQRSHSAFILKDHILARSGVGHIPQSGCGFQTSKRHASYSHSQRII